MNVKKNKPVRGPQWPANMPSIIKLKYKMIKGGTHVQH
jgi:hypothetical protein